MAEISANGKSVSADVPQTPKAATILFPTAPAERMEAAEENSDQVK